ncbi:MAG: hypothetical protein FJZ43_03205 [Candidatus Staskawiczbacteria bacterium]|nr:hypothetical protein [Candidatus Staskawiczbacteria bacterium]
MKKYTLVAIIFLLFFVIAGFWIYKANNNLEIENQNQVINAKNCTYIIDNKEFKVTNGFSEEIIEIDSASKITTQYFGNEVKDDFNGDGLKDASFIITQNSGGSGTFYYITTVLGSNKKECISTNSILLGDRIAPQVTNYINGQIVVNYADRKEGEPMTTNPSLGVSRYFTIQNYSLIEIKK